MGCACGKGRRAPAASSPATRMSGPTGGTKTTVYTVTCADGFTKEYTNPGEAALAAKDPKHDGCTMTAVRK